MRIGELLVERCVLPRSELASQLADQARLGMRTCSLLIERGLIDFDEASKALGAQRHLACALSKHLDRRDPELAQLLSAGFAINSCALPIGRTAEGVLIVCVRDPSAQLLAALRAETRGEVGMVIAPAARVERLVAETYGQTGEAAPLLDPARFPSEGRPLSLARLDSPSVDRHVDASTKAVPVALPRPTTPSRQRQRPTLPPIAPTLDVTTRALDRASTSDAAEDLAMACVEGRWLTGALFDIRSGKATLRRGFALARDAAGEVVLSLGSPSTLQIAAESRSTSTTIASGPVQKQLAELLGMPAVLTVVPVVVGGTAVAAFATGGSIYGSTDTDVATAELGKVALSLGAVYQRLGKR